MVIEVMLLLLSHFSRVRLCATPSMAAHPGSPVPGILQARTLEWVAISFSNAWKWKVKVKSLNRVQFLATPWTADFRLLHPWDFPGKSTGVGCHCLLLDWSHYRTTHEVKLNGEVCLYPSLTITSYYHYPDLTFNPGKSIRKERRMVKVLAPAESM